MALSKSVLKKIYKVHIYVGLFVAIHFFIFAVSGLFLLFKDDFESSTPAETVLEKSSLETTAQQYAQVLQNLQSLYPTDLPLALFPDEHNPNILNARSGLDGSKQLRGARKTNFSLLDTQEIKTSPARATGFFNWMLELHRELFLGSNGKLYVSFIGFLYVMILISGFYLYGPFMRTRLFGEIRSAPKRFQWIDLHKFTGIVTFGWSFIVGLSGVFLALNSVLIKLFQFQSLKHLSAQYAEHTQSSSELAPFADIMRSALNAKPDYMISYVSFPYTEFGIPGHFLFLINGTTPLTEKISELLVVNAQNGQLTEIVELPLYLKIVLLSEPLHFGDYGGLFLKILWVLFTLASLLVVGLGVFSFMQKRKKYQHNGAATTTAALTLQTSLQRNGFFRQSNYAVPAVLLILIVAGLTGSLFTTGWIAFIAQLFVVIPLVVLILGRLKNANPK